MFSKPTYPTYNLGTGVDYKESDRGARLPVSGVYSVKDIFPDVETNGSNPTQGTATESIK